MNKAAIIKSRIFLVSIAILLLTAGCGKSNNDAALQSGTQPSAVETTAVSTSAVASSSKAPRYTVTAAEFSQDKIHIRYPQINGLGDDKAEKVINDMIKNDIWKSQAGETLDNYQKDGEKVALDVDVDYKVTMSTDKLLSIMFTGSAYVEGGMHPNNVFYGMTIDLKSAKRLYLSDFTPVNKDLARKIKQSTAITNVAVESQTSENDKKSVIQNLGAEINQKSDQDLIWELKNENDSGFYLMPDSLIASVGVSHASGDYALVEIPGQYTNETGNDTHADENLSYDNERILFSFNLENSAKTVSVCMSSGDSPYIVYRFGTKDNIEMEYPADKENSWDKFTYIDGGNGGNYGLKFENGGYAYQIYQKYDSGSKETSAGVKVTELSTGKVTDLKGVNGSQIGFISALTSYNQNIKTVKS